MIDARGRSAGVISAVKIAFWVLTHRQRLIVGTTYRLWNSTRLGSQLWKRHSFSGMTRLRRSRIITIFGRRATSTVDPKPSSAVWPRTRDMFILLFLCNTLLSYYLYFIFSHC